MFFSENYSKSFHVFVRIKEAKNGLIPRSTSNAYKKVRYMSVNNWDIINPRIRCQLSVLFKVMYDLDF